MPYRANLPADPGPRRRETAGWRGEFATVIDRAFEALGICFVLLDRQFNFIRVNRVYAEACGHPPEYFTGKNHFALYPGAEAEAIFRRVVETGESFSVKSRPFRFPDYPARDVTYWDWTLQPLRNAGDRVEQLLFALWEVTGRRRVESELSSRMQELAAVAELGARALTSESQPALWAEAAAMITANLRVPFCDIHELQPDRRALKLVAGAGWGDGLVGRVVREIEPSTEVDFALNSGAPVHVEDFGADLRFRASSLYANHGVASGICLPIGSPGEPQGLLGAWASHPRAFAAEDVVFLQSVAHLLAVAMARWKAEEAALDLARRLLSAEGAERSRIARELHDSTAQGLIAATLNLNSLRAWLPADVPQVAARLDDITALLENCTHEIRTLSYVLHPPALDETGLPGAIRHYVAGFGERTGIATSVDLPPAWERQDETVELVLYRVVQESLGNIHRHARSPSAAVRLQPGDTGLELEIRDAGGGIAPHLLGHESGRQPGLGVGIPGMRKRLGQIGGRLHIESGPSGTTIRAIVPRRKSDG